MAEETRETVRALVRRLIKEGELVVTQAESGVALDEDDADDHSDLTAFDLPGEYEDIVPPGLHIEGPDGAALPGYSIEPVGVLYAEGFDAPVYVAWNRAPLAWGESDAE